MFFEVILETLANIVIFMITSLGYFGIVLAMAIESACIPLPSEIIMPFSGFLVHKGVFDFWLVSLAGGFGCLVGSMIAYWIGHWKGEEWVRLLIRKYGKFILVFEYELDDAIHWFKKYGSAIAFTSRLLPVVRTFISLPAGISGMDVKKFAFYTFVGSFIWSTLLAYVGVKLGENWDTLGTYFHKFDAVIFLVFLALGGLYIYHKLHKHKKHKLKNKK